ncbi:MAG: hypothetical protein KC776_27775 [Myxococcales bacterium]|nr:hypothetical protein [Myxococcales bacterium]MCB9577637.1 hypothetical protein [Polyangiaceae bacterium]
MSVTLREVMGAARSRAASLAAEVAGYLVLGAADQAAARAVTGDDVVLGEDGTVRIASGHSADDAQAEAALRLLLGQLLLEASSVTPALLRASQRPAAAGIDALVQELEAALIPVNRGAGRRALARLHRDTDRARAAGALEPTPAPVVAEVEVHQLSEPEAPVLTPIAPLSSVAPTAVEVSASPVEAVASVLVEAALPEPPRELSWLSPEVAPVAELTPSDLAIDIDVDELLESEPAPAVCAADLEIPELELPPSPVPLAVAAAAPPREELTVPEPVIQRRAEGAHTPQLGSAAGVLLPEDATDRMPPVMELLPAECTVVIAEVEERPVTEVVERTQPLPEVAEVRTEAEATAEPVAEAVAVGEPVAEAVTVGEPVAEAVGEPVAEAVGEPVAEAETVAVGEPVAEAVGEPVAEAVGEPVAEAVGEPEAEAVAVGEPVVEAEPEGFGEAWPEAVAADPFAGAWLEAVAELEAEPEAVAAGPVVRPDPEFGEPEVVDDSDLYSVEELFEHARSATLPQRAAGPARYAPPRYAPRQSDVSDLLRDFGVASVGDDRELCRDLKLLAGMDATGAPPSVESVTPPPVAVTTDDEDDEREEPAAGGRARAAVGALCALLLVGAAGSTALPNSRALASGGVRSVAARAESRVQREAPCSAEVAVKRVPQDAQVTLRGGAADQVLEPSQRQDDRVAFSGLPCREAVEVTVHRTRQKRWLRIPVSAARLAPPPGAPGRVRVTLLAR